MEHRGRFFPEQHTRQPVRGRVSLAVSAPPRPGSRPDGRVITPDRPVAPDIPRPGTKTKHTGRNIVLGTTALGALGVGAYEAYQNVPAIHQMVDQAFLSHLRGDQLVSTDTTAKPVEKFDNTATSGEIKPNDFVSLSEEELNKLDPLAKIDDHNTVQVLYPIDVSTSNNPDAKIKYKKAYTGNGNEQDRINRAEQGFLNVFNFESVPAGSTILAPVDGRLTVYYAYPRNFNPALANNDHPIGTAAIDFQARDGEQYRILISGGSTKGGMMNARGDVFKSLTNAPMHKDGMSPSEALEIKEQAIPVKKGQRILDVADMEINLAFFMRGSIDMSKPDKWTFKEEVIDGKTVRIAMEDPTNLELFLSDGLIVQPPASTKRN